MKTDLTTDNRKHIIKANQLERQLRKKLRHAANRVALELFTDGFQKRALRLLLEDEHGRVMCGLGFKPAADRIYALLTKRFIPRNMKGLV